jgi:hypothetical protein
VLCNKANCWDILSLKLATLDYCWQYSARSPVSCNLVLFKMTAPVLSEPRPPSPRLRRESELQDQDSLVPEDVEFTCVSEAQPTEHLLRDLRFAWRCVKHIKSNAIAIAKDEKLLGIGAGQPNRVKSTDIALERVRTLAADASLLYRP